VALARLESLYSIVFSFGGIPLLYMGDEIALRNDPNWADDPAHADDNRWLHRPPTDWAAAERRSDPATPEGCMFRALRDLAAARSRIPAFRANASATCLDLRPPSLFAYRRGGAHRADGPLLALVDLGGSGHIVGADSIHSAGIGEPELRHTGRPGASLVDGALHLAPYGFAWVSG
jgi:amylosucrase